MRTGHVHAEDASATPGLHVFVDGRDAGLAPWDGDLEPGTHQVDLRGERAVSRPQIVRLSPRSAIDLVFETTPVPLPVAVTRLARVVVTTVPARAALRIDGEPVASPFEGQLSQGRHLVEVWAPGYASAAASFDVPLASPEIVLVLLPLEKPKPPARLGVWATSLALPRPVEVELSLRQDEHFEFGIEYSTLPKVSLATAEVQMSALQGFMRWFPGRGPFFLGVGFGIQQFKVSASADIAGALPIAAYADMRTFLISPQIGWHWVFESGLAVGVGFGVEVPLASESRSAVLYGGSSILGDSASGLVTPTIVAKEQQVRGDVQDAARVIANIPLPTLDLLKVGFYF